jgi:predicted PP-loop superfamily ATPase
MSENWMGDLSEAEKLIMRKQRLFDVDELMAIVDLLNRGWEFIETEDGTLKIIAPASIREARSGNDA